MTAQPVLASVTSTALILFNGAFQPFQAAIGFAILGYLFTTYMIPRVSPSFVKRGLYGKDMSKVGKPIIPETIGVIPAICYLFLMILFIPFMYIRYYYNQPDTYDSEAASLFPNGKLSSFLSGMLCLESMVLLGLMDDLFDIRWRHKFFLPAIAAIPLLVIYYVDFGVTDVLIPKIIRRYLQVTTNSIDLGIFYYFYMAAVAIFCPNSVNILAGVNGLEVGQTAVIAVLLLLNDFCYLFIGDSSSPAYSVHLYSSCMLIPFLGTALGLLKYNWYPSKVFVGDTWCYFSGMVFAVVGISGHFAKTLMLFFVPQIFNFIYSLPQLFGLVPCPRHRLPHFNPEDNLMYNSWTEYTEKQPVKPVMIPIFNAMEKLKLIALIRDKNGTIIKSSNMTVINLVIIWFGPKREDHLCMLIMLLQFLTGLTMLLLRHTVAPMLFGFDNSWNMLTRFYKK
ncbi:DEKNAAC103070 [Brettanomyces naardenensis]|uniref:UDP-N-acetylglucosamine--dolichyl-phosphate N-acetylglucosaminephosphotransferase n=1 Tax=Brettanomyces naardenensis TaxID=13370 RepID=A0A448YMC5_BRENA|nr:DEKNAAC103070 [Brettanomyces naardenensis]